MDLVRYVMLVVKLKLCVDVRMDLKMGIVLIVMGVVNDYISSNTLDVPMWFGS
jgi:hypothetical protein